MAKLGDLIRSINQQVNSNELEALAGASGVQEIEVQDDTLNEVSEKLKGLMSVEAAKNNPQLSEHFKKQLHPTIKGEILGNIDTDISQNTKDLFGEEALKEFEGLDYTGDKVKKVFELSKKMIESKSADENLKKQHDNLKKQLKELEGNFNNELQQKQKELETAQSDFKNKLIQKEFSNLMSKYKLGDKYQDEFIKNALTENMFKTVKKKANLIFNEDGEIVPRSADDPSLELYEGNKKVESIKQLLDPLMEPYISKNPTVKVEYEKSKEPEKLSALGRSFIRQRQESNGF